MVRYHKTANYSTDVSHNKLEEALELKHIIWGEECIIDLYTWVGSISVAVISYDTMGRERGGW